MFNKEIESKIIDFIKKSPIGVSSSEIARYLNINRITLTKYLDVIKERASIDFKPFGMAKLWFVPVKIDKDSFFKELTTNLASNLDETKAKEIVAKLGNDIAENLALLYKEFYNLPQMSKDQIAEAIIDAEKKIGGDFVIVDKTDERIVLKVKKCPFGQSVMKSPVLCNITSSICGVMASKNTGYSKVNLKKTIAQGNNECDIWLYLKKTKESET